jgi:hypothetical protein
MFLWKYLKIGTFVGRCFFREPSRFLNFSKSAGVAPLLILEQKIIKQTIFTSLVRGQYAKSSFTELRAIKVLIN